MRLAPVVIFHLDAGASAIREAATASSRTTHAGQSSGFATAFLAHLLGQAIKRPVDDARSAAHFLSTEISAYTKASLGGNCANALLRMLSSTSSVPSERCWRWKDPCLGITETLAARGTTWNGYPVNPTYFGSYCIDCLAIALHSVYHTKSFAEAIEKCINFLGDADSTASVAGQIAGAFYGARGISTFLHEGLFAFDGGEFAVKAGLLRLAGHDAHSSSRRLSRHAGQNCGDRELMRWGDWRSQGRAASVYTGPRRRGPGVLIAESHL